MVWWMARPEHAPVDSLAVAPVGQEVIGTLAWSPPAGSWHPDGVEHHRELRAVVALPRGYDHRQGPPLPVAGEVHLGGKPAPSSPERFLGGVLYPPLFRRLCSACFGRLRRAGAPAPLWSRRSPTTLACPPRQSWSARRRAASPRSRRAASGRSGRSRFARVRSGRAGRARGRRS